MEQGFGAVRRAAKGIAAILLISGAVAAQAVTVHTTAFLPEPTNRNGFEAMLGGTSHTEQGITVSYVGRVSSIWRTFQVNEGLQSWYPNAGALGYTRVTFDDTVTSFQFAAGTGWVQGDPALQYKLLMDGSVVAEGVIAGLDTFPGFRTLGFSGIDFDEVHLQSLEDDRPFFEGGYDALVLDSFAHGGRIGVVPEPGTWAMMILGFGLAGVALRRRPAPRTA